ncbi:MAG: ABC transporter substrate-binding protein [SAR324 cluster bacterium]|nr:ABC transporter substrate-binding protein [SAR324 cluster bacterium]
MKLTPPSCLLALLIVGSALPSKAPAETLTIACGAVGIEYRLCREGAEAWGRRTGHQVRLVQSPNLSNNRLGLFQQMLASGSSDVDVFQIDVIWPGILGAHLVDLRPYVDSERLAGHYPALIANNTVGGELKALPWFVDVGLLYYRRDLLEAHGLRVPETWAALGEAARTVLEAERAAGNTRLTGYVFQARAYEGLTCNALEWIDSFGGGSVVEADGSISLNNPQAVRALETVAAWIGSVAPRGVLTYGEEDARGVFQSGNAVFMRNWPYAWALLNGADSPVRGRVGVTSLPSGGAGGRHSATLGGWGLAVSRYSEHPALAADLIDHLTGPKEQARRAIAGAFNPTFPALYRDPALLAAQPLLADLAQAVERAVARPSTVTGERYNRVSTIFWNAVHDTLSGKASAGESLAAAERRLRRLSRGGRW